MTAKTTRICAGLYRVSDSQRTVTITQYTKREGAGFNGWVAAAQWDRWLLTDPCWTKADAVREARAMLAEA